MKMIVSCTSKNISTFVLHSLEDTGYIHHSSLYQHFSFSKSRLETLFRPDRWTPAAESSPLKETLDSISHSHCVMQIKSNIKRPR